MATNNIELTTAQTAIIDEIYRAEAVTNILEAPSELVRYSGGKSFQIADIALTGLETTTDKMAIQKAEFL